MWQRSVFPFVAISKIYFGECVWVKKTTVEYPSSSQAKDYVLLRQNSLEFCNESAGVDCAGIRWERTNKQMSCGTR